MRTSLNSGVQDQVIKKPISKFVLVQSNLDVPQEIQIAVKKLKDFVSCSNDTFLNFLHKWLDPEAKRVALMKKNETIEGNESAKIFQTIFKQSPMKLNGWSG